MAKRLFLFVAFSLWSCLAFYADESVVNVEANGLTTGFAISELRKLYFSEDNLIVLKKSGEEQVFAIDDIVEMTITGLTGILSPEAQAETITLFKRLENGKMIIEKNDQRWDINGMLIKSNK